MKTKVSLISLILLFTLAVSMCSDPVEIKQKPAIKNLIEIRSQANLIAVCERYINFAITDPTNFNDAVLFQTCTNYLERVKRQG